MNVIIYLKLPYVINTCVRLYLCRNYHSFCMKTCASQFIFSHKKNLYIHKINLTIVSIIRLSNCGSILWKMTALRACVLRIFPDMVRRGPLVELLFGSFFPWASEKLCKKHYRSIVFPVRKPLSLSTDYVREKGDQVQEKCVCVVRFGRPVSQCMASSQLCLRKVENWEWYWLIDDICSLRTKYSPNSRNSGCFVYTPEIRVHM